MVTYKRKSDKLGLVLAGIAVIAVIIWLLHPRHPYNKCNLQANSVHLSKYENLVPVAVIGSGPAGLAAALYGARGGVHSVVFEGESPGGQLMTTTWVENWPGRPKSLGPDLITSLKEQAAEFGAQYVRESVSAVDFSSWPYRVETAQGTVAYAMSIVIATGAQPRLLYVPGEQEYWSKGVTTCAVCDAPFYKEKEVVVVGGGDSAFEEALQLAPYAKKITILVRRDVLRASQAMQERIKPYEHIDIKFNTQIKVIKGDNTQVTHIEVEEQGEEKIVPIDGVFLAIGHTPITKNFKPTISTHEGGYIALTGNTQHTNIPGVFAAGDVADFRYRQAGVAAGDGIKAALEGLEFLREVGYNEVIEEALHGNMYVPEGGKDRKALADITSLQALKDVQKKHDYVVLDFYTDICPSCVQILPTLEEAHMSYETNAGFYKINIMDVPELAEMYEVNSAPTILILQDGKIIARVQEGLSSQQLHDLFKKIMKQ